MLRSSSLRAASAMATRRTLCSTRALSSLPSFATVDPDFSGAKPTDGFNLVNGKWTKTAKTETILDPLNGEEFMTMPLTQKNELAPFVESMTSCPKHGLHNPLKNVERYIMYGEICAKAGARFREEKVADYFAKLVQRTSPKSYFQARNEVKVTGKFLENFSGDQVRFLVRSFGVPGDHQGQASHGYRWPYGPVALITPFNFPIEIPVLQMMGALFMGNKVLLKVDSKVSIVMQETLRLLHECGMPLTDVDFINSDGAAMNDLLLQVKPRNTLFTGSQAVAEKLAKDLSGRIKLEDAGFDWKVLGPDVRDFDYVAWTSDQDAYACSGQKCSAQSILFMHKNWPTAVFVPLKEMIKPENFELVTTEIFGPFQILTEYDDSDLPHVLDSLERMEAHLTAAVVSNDPHFTHEVLSATVNGTTYSGIRARTTGAPQNHWFGPAGDPCAGGIGTPEAIKLVWSCHREIINDIGPVPANWTIPEAT
ncbi:hypothetical protein BBJ29_003460 [Phytophthora kernoviae]|uniref:Aldehyde dehydrogenase domain-containing protein n=1 Tax=Phytophthora kernoviae TaxID=325452 RepID=A0A3F2RNQ8_9STRA|nr:hypothetical protein BBJ29_003460 [Phytophthora kernoviae]RLN60072.1 hypothetical protein BBP00_00006179 [Phytophthora kernoviae]